MATTDILSVTALIGFGGLGVAVAKLWHDLRSERRRSSTDAGRIKVESEQAANFGRLAKTHAREVEELKKLVASLAEMVASYNRELVSLRKEVEIGRREPRSSIVLPQMLAEIERQKLEQRKAEASWAQARDIAKGLGWILGRMSKEEDDDEYEE